MSDVVFLKIKNISKKDVQETVKKAMKMGQWDKYITGKIFIKINNIQSDF